MRFQFISNKTQLLSAIFIALNFFKTDAQCPTQQSVINNLNALENNQRLPGAKKLQQLYILKRTYEDCIQKKDSDYARILLKIGSFEFTVNKNFTAAIQNTNASIIINTSTQVKGSKFFVAKAYFNLAKFYEMLGTPNKALIYYDSTILAAQKFPDTTTFLFYSKFNKVYLHFLNGDYQKAIEESIDGMQYSLYKKDTSAFLAFLNQKAQSLYFENKLSLALADVQVVISFAKKQNELFELASGLKTKAMIFKKKQNFIQANLLFDSTIKIRIKTDDYRQISLDYIDYGNFLLDSLHDYNSAKKNYFKTIKCAEKINDSSTIALAMINTGDIYLDQSLYVEANYYCLKSFKYLNIPVNDIYAIPLADKLNSISYKQLPVVIINNKVETMLGLFIKTKDEKLLTGCLQTCLVMDTLITKMRNSQFGIDSKLYWRNYTSDFYANAIKGSYLAQRPDLAFHFMEKSRAVLLNDNLNELTALSLLSKADLDKKEEFEIEIIELEQKLSSFSDTSNLYHTTQLHLITIRSNYEHFIKSLEQNYPAYYQLKYDDEVPSLKDLQQYLAKNNQSFVHYFFGDTASYILAITANKTNFIRLSQKEFNKNQLADFIRFCSNKQALNNHYDSFAALSNAIYTKIFQPLYLPKGRVVICTENTVIPFDALCKDKNGKNFLLNDYSFDYVYSARFLMKQFKNAPAHGNFIGYAPVSFAKSLHAADLKNAAEALQASADYYKNDKLYTLQTASRNNFFNYAANYSVVNIFSHARADTTDNEPVLFMQDSLIHLSELQRLTNPATQLVLLSACQTNVGKAATGEGIYSLARGFATAGIPSVSATLWKADEQSVYSISQTFNQYLSEGMTKDEALQKAKLYYFQNHSSDESFPYYWANMILIGNADALKLSNNSSNNYVWIISIIAIVLIVATVISIRKKSFK